MPNCVYKHDIVHDPCLAGNRVAVHVQHGFPDFLQASIDLTRNAWCVSHKAAWVS